MRSSRRFRARIPPRPPDIDDEMSILSDPIRRELRQRFESELTGNVRVSDRRFERIDVLER